MMTTTVTQELWQAVAGAHRSKTRGPRMPVEMVSPLQACRFANALSRVLGLEAVYEFPGDTVTWSRQRDGFRLPTELEWESACRGPAPTAALGKRAWFKGNSGGKLHEVARLEASPLGLYDMLGNTWEICWDEVRDTKGNPKRATKGGAASSKPNRLTAASRGMAPFNGPNYLLGFRLVRGPSTAAGTRPVQEPPRSQQSGLPVQWSPPG